jgi:UDP-N-acetylmuramate dehydrogenase
VLKRRKDNLPPFILELPEVSRYIVAVPATESTIGKILKKINITESIRRDEPMSRHTTFRIGGPADFFFQPEDPAEVPALFALLRGEGVPCFLLGGGANILVADRGIRGAVVDLSGLRGCRPASGLGGEPGLEFLAGTPVSAACEEALRLGLSGLEFLYSMPGSVGGAVWMNARCYSRSVSDVLAGVEVADGRGGVRLVEPRPEQFDYKVSPFQRMDALILRASFRLAPGDPQAIQTVMQANRSDREAKGHFLWPCAGSVWKNNRAFGEPTGRILDSLGCKGLRVGDAAVSDRHANIIVNLGRATAAEVLELMQAVEARVWDKRGYRLEREVLVVGETGQA